MFINIRVKVLSVKIVCKMCPFCTCNGTNNQGICNFVNKDPEQQFFIPFELSCVHGTNFLKYIVYKTETYEKLRFLCYKFP